MTYKAVRRGDGTVRFYLLQTAMKISFQNLFKTVQ